MCLEASLDRTTAWPGRQGNHFPLRGDVLPLLIHISILSPAFTSTVPSLLPPLSSFHAAAARSSSFEDTAFEDTAAPERSSSFHAAAARSASVQGTAKQLSIATRPYSQLSQVPMLPGPGNQQATIAMNGLSPCKYSPCPSFGLHNQYIYPIQDRSAVYDKLEVNVRQSVRIFISSIFFITSNIHLVQASALFEKTNADVVVLFGRPDKTHVSYYVSPGISNDPDTRTLFASMFPYFETIMAFRRGIFQARLVEVDLDKERQKDNGGKRVYNVPRTNRSTRELPVKLGDYLFSLGITEDQWIVVEAIWIEFVEGDGRLTLSEDLDGLGFSADVKTQVELHFYRELAQLR